MMGEAILLAVQCGRIHESYLSYRSNALGRFIVASIVAAIAGASLIDGELSIASFFGAIALIFVASGAAEIWFARSRRREYERKIAELDVAVNAAVAEREGVQARLEAVVERACR